MTPEQYAQSGRSVYWDAIAAGLPADQAAKMTLELGDRLPPAAAAAGVARVTAAPIAAAGNIYNSVCVTAYGTYHFIFGTACLQQSYLSEKPGDLVYREPKSWQVVPRQLTGMNLLRLQSNYRYCNKYTYTRVGWSPSSTINKGERHVVQPLRQLRPGSACPFRRISTRDRSARSTPMDRRARPSAVPGREAPTARRPAATSTTSTPTALRSSTTARARPTTPTSR